MEKKKNILVWVLPLLGILLLAIVMLKRAPETFDDNGASSPEEEGVDESMLSYRELKSIGFELEALSALTLDSKDNIYVAGDKQLLILNPEGSGKKTIVLPDTGRCLTVAEDGKIYVGFKRHIAVYDQDGKELAAWDKIDDNSFLTALALSGEFLFAADAGSRSVWKFDLKGKLLGKIGVENKQEGIPKFIVPSPYFDLTAATDGSIWIVNPGLHKLENFTADGTLTGMWGKYSPEMEGFCGCCNPTHIALLKDGSLVTSEKGYPRVKIYDPKGVFKEVVAGEAQFKEGTKGLDLAVDSRGKILVLDPKMKIIRIFKKK